MSLLSDLTDSLAITGMKDGEWGVSSMGAALIPTAISAVAKLFGDQGTNDISKQQLAQQAAISQAELANRLEIAKLQAASAGAGSGAALAVARITDARERQRMKMEAEQAMLAGKFRAIEMIKPEVIAQAGANRVNAALQGSNNIANAYAATGQLMSPAYTRPR